MYRKMAVIMLSALSSSAAWALEEKEQADVVTVDQAAKKAYVLEYEKPEHFLNDFLNVCCRKDKPIKYWASQLILFFQRDPKLKEFCRELARAVPSRDPMRIGMVFITYQHCFAPEMKCVILKDIKKVWNALEARCKCELGKK